MDTLGFQSRFNNMHEIISLTRFIIIHQKQNKKDKKKTIHSN